MTLEIAETIYICCQEGIYEASSIICFLATEYIGYVLCGTPKVETAQQKVF